MYVFISLNQDMFSKQNRHTGFYNMFSVYHTVTTKHANIICSKQKHRELCLKAFLQIRQNRIL